MRKTGRETVLADLRAALRRVERAPGIAHPLEEQGFCLLPEGTPGQLAPPPLSLGALHEVRAAEQRDRPAAAAFLLALLARGFATSARPILWCEERGAALDFGTLYGPGLAGFGLDPATLIIVRTKTTDDLLWAMEEGVRAGALSAVVGVFGAHGGKTRDGGLGLAASRRLQLAAEKTGTTAFFLRQPSDENASVARTRWIIAGRPSGEDPVSSLIGQPRWQITLDKCRGGLPGTWHMEWHYATHHFRLVPPLADGSLLPVENGAGNPERNPDRNPERKPEERSVVPFARARRTAA